MAKSGRFFVPSEANSLEWYILASIITGIAMGIGNVLGQIMTKAALKKAGYAGLLPEEIKEEANK